MPGITFHHDLDLEGPGVLLLAECPGSDNTCSELSQVVNVTQAFHRQVWFLTDYSICTLFPNTSPYVIETMGVIYSFIAQAFPPQSEFSVDDIPDLTGKVIIVTGGNAGALRNYILEIK